MRRRVLLISIDRLGKSFLGPYGNTWLETPAINQFAAESLLCEYPIADSLDPREFVNSVCTGQHRFQRSHQDDAIRSESTTGLGDWLRKQDRQARMYSDETAVLERAEAFGFDEVIEIEDDQQAEQLELAEEIEQTRLMRFFAAAATLLNDDTESDFVWLHTGLLSRAWDAPLAIRTQHHDEDDPDPWDGVLPPSRSFDSGDQDELFPLTMAYGAQIQVLDEALHLFWSACQLIPAWKDALCILTSPRGYPLGEHQRIGDFQETLHAESIDIPLMIRQPDSQRLETASSSGARLSQIVQPHDLYQTVLEWLGGSPESSEVSLSSRNLLTRLTVLPNRNSLAVSQTQNELGIRTWAWYYLRGDRDDSLFVKPDDIWEVNNIADRCLDVIEEMKELTKLLSSSEHQVQEQVSDDQRETNQTLTESDAGPSTSSKPLHLPVESQPPTGTRLELSSLLKWGYQ